MTIHPIESPNAMKPTVRNGDSLGRRPTTRWLALGAVVGPRSGVSQAGAG